MGKIDDAADKMKDATDRAADKAKDAAKSAGDKIERSRRSDQRRGRQDQRRSVARLAGPFRTRRRIRPVLRLPADDPRLLSAVWPACVGALAVLYANVETGAWTRRSAIGWMMGAWGARLDRAGAIHTSLRARILVLALLRLLASRPFPTSLLTSYFRLLTFVSVLFSPGAARVTQRRALALVPRDRGRRARGSFAFTGETTADRQFLRFTSSRRRMPGLRCRQACGSSASARARRLRSGDLDVLCVVCFRFTLGMDRASPARRRCRLSPPQVGADGRQSPMPFSWHASCSASSCGHDS